MPLMNNPLTSTHWLIEQSFFKCRLLPIQCVTEFLFARQDKPVLAGEQLLVAFLH
jgi:hypothetical protein